MAERAIDKFKRIKALKCFNQVEEMLYAGFPVAAVASYIQVRMNEYKDVKRGSLIVMLKMFRKTLSVDGLVRSSLPRVFVDAEKKFANKMNELERLEDQYLLDQYRMDVLHGEERMTGAINPQVDKIGKSMRDTVVKMHNIKMDLGLVGSRDLGTITVSAERIEYIKNKYGEGAAKAFADPVSRGRVLAALNAIRRAGNLRDKDGQPLELTQHMKLSDEEREKIVDVEYEVTDGDDVPDDDGEGEGSAGDGGPPEPPFVPRGDDLNEAEGEEDYDERVEALSPDLEPGDDAVPPPVKDPRVEPVEMAPDHGRIAPNLPPGPMKPGIRANVESRMTTKVPPKKDSKE